MCKTGCSAQIKNLSQSFTIRIWKRRVCMLLLETRSEPPMMPNWEKLDKWRNEDCPHLPDPINKRLGEILILGTTASLIAGQPFPLVKIFFCTGKDGK